MLLDSADVPRALARDYQSADLSEPDRAMLDYAVLLTREPGEIDEARVTRLREAGFDDTAILDICQVTAYYNYVNRLADGLGVELESSWTDEEMTITLDEFQTARESRSTRVDQGE